MKATPTNFEHASSLLRAAKGGRLRLGNNTYLEYVNPELADGFIGVRLHNTYIVRFYRDGRVTLHTGGYHTVTTKERINQFTSKRVYQKDHVWYVVGHTPEGALDWDNPVEFTEGMNVGTQEVL